MSIVTKTGDTGETGLFGGGRVRKDDARIEAIGTVDELNSLLGLAVAAGHLRAEDATQLLHVQHLLFRVGGDLCTPMEKESKQRRMDTKDITELETWIGALEAALRAQTHFILPGGSHAAALLHTARTVCRRAERRTVTLAKSASVNAQVTVYLNRLSDYLFLLARKANANAGIGDVRVSYE
jgi:cob(I)alamin adenosyltransferase